MLWTELSCKKVENTQFCLDTILSITYIRVFWILIYLIILNLNVTELFKLKFTIV